MNGHDVVEAQKGDAAAFARLVTRHGPVAERFARLWMSDTAAAEDVVQDALLDAYLHLHQLRTPEAFTGWLRRIVLKHCDRHRRRRGAPPLEPGVGTLDDELGETSRALRAAIDALPEHERDAVALHYLGERSQAEVAETLGISLAAVKKRLQRARERLETLPRPEGATTPSADRVGLFLALRSGDLTSIDVLLDRSPELLDAPESWSVDEALLGRFPLAHHHTPLVLASQQGDLAAVRKLLGRGAVVDTPCGCAAGDTALLSATLHGRSEIAELLIDAGANVHAANRKGFTALHLARWRGQDALADRLEAAGAEPRPSVDGHTPANLAEAHQKLAAEVRGRALSSTAPGQALATGIRALDAFTPLRTGMTVRVHGAAETGLMVLLSELSLRLGWLGLPVSWVSWLPYPWYRGELETIAAGAGGVAEVYCEGGIGPCSDGGPGRVRLLPAGSRG